MTTPRAPAAPVAAWRTAAVYIDCPTDRCGGGAMAGYNGSFLLAEEDMRTMRPGDTVTCSECQNDFRLPEGPFKAMGVKKGSA